MTDHAPEPPQTAPPQASRQASPQAVPTRPPVSHQPRRASPIAWTVSLALAALVGAALFVGGYLAAGATGAGSCAAPNEAFEPFCEAYEKLKDRFVDSLEDDKLAEGAIRGMFEYGVEDPFSGYMSPEDYRRARSDLSGRFSGIGAEMGVRNLVEPGDLEACSQFSEECALVVIAPLPDSPAEGAGLQPGDVVLAIDDESTDGLTLEDAVQRIRGESGSDVTLTLRRDAEAFDVTITRAEIQMREVTSEMLEDNVGYVALHGFSDAASSQFHDAIAELLEQGATSIVFDLRNNPGGYIEAARQVASEFIDDGVLFIQESSGDEVKEWESTGEGLATDPDLPVVVIVNGGSASASEIVAAALKERERATVVGQPTYGKNTVQLWEDLENGGGVRITISRWFTPGHNSVAPDGVQPDVTVEVPDGTPPEQDLFLEAAIRAVTSSWVGTDGEAAPSPAGAVDTDALSPFTAPFSWDPRALVRIPA